MKKLYIAIVLLLVAMPLAAANDIIYLKNGKSYIGQITDINEKTISIKTSLGVRTYPWKVLQVKTIKRYNPSLYEVIREEKRKEFEKKKAKLGLVKYEKAGKVKWVLPKQKEELEMRDKGMEMFEEEWTPTNKVAEIKFRRKMEAKGMTEYKGKWYDEQELADVKELEVNKGLKVGMTTQEVIAKWGKPTLVKKSVQFKAQRMVMWFYEDEKNEKEDRLLFKLGHLDTIWVDEPLSDKL